MRKRTIRILALLMAAVFCLCLASCGKPANSTDAETKEPTTAAGTPSGKDASGATDTASPSQTAEPTNDTPTGQASAPSTGQTTAPSTEPTTEPTSEPSTEPTTEPTSEPSTEPTSEPSAEPSPEPTSEPTPTEKPTEPTTPVDDPNAVHFYLEDVSGKPGEEVTINVMIDNNPGIAGFSVCLVYDTTKLEYVSSRNKVSGGFGVDNHQTPGDVHVMCTRISPFITENDLCYTVTLKIKDDAPVGVIEIPLIARDDRDTIYAWDGVAQPVAYKLTGCKLTVTK